MVLRFGQCLNPTNQQIKQAEMHCVVLFSLCASAWVCGHSLATSLPVVWTYSLSVLSRCLFACYSGDQTPSPPWCDSPATLMNGSAQRPSATVKCPLGLHQSQKEQSGLARTQIPTVLSDHGRAEATEKIKGENIRQKEEHRSNQAWWKGAAWGLSLMSLTSPHGLQGRTPLKWVNFAPVITAQTQESQISLSISHHCIESWRESWLTDDIVLKWAVSLSLPLSSDYQALSVTFPDGLLQYQNWAVVTRKYPKYMLFCKTIKKGKRDENQRGQI